MSFHEYWDFFFLVVVALLDVAEEGDAPHGPVPGADVGLEVDGPDVVQVGAGGLPAQAEHRDEARLDTTSKSLLSWNITSEAKPNRATPRGSVIRDGVFSD